MTQPPQQKNIDSNEDDEENPNSQSMALKTIDIHSSDSQVEGKDPEKQKFKNLIVNFLEDNTHCFRKTFLEKIQNMMNAITTNQQVFRQLVEVSSMCLNYLANEVACANIADSLTETKQERSPKDYEALEEAVQKAEQEVRKHIGIQHQMKVCMDQLDEGLESMQKKIAKLQKEKDFYKKDILLLNKKLKQSQEVFIYLNKFQEVQFLKEQNLTMKNTLKQYEAKKKSLKNTRLFTEQQHSSMSRENSKKSMVKVYGSKSNLPSRVQSRNASQVKLLSNSINVNLQNYLTSSNNQPISHEQSKILKKPDTKEMFWNRKLKRRDSMIGRMQIDRSSVNVSPRQLKSKKKQKDLLKGAYQSSTIKQSKTIRNHTVLDQDMMTSKIPKNKKKQKRMFEVSRSLMDRAKSVAS